MATVSLQLAVKLLLQPSPCARRYRSYRLSELPFASRLELRTGIALQLIADLSASAVRRPRKVRVGVILGVMGR